MKKFKHILLWVIVLFSVNVFAENVGKVNAIYSHPAAFKPDQEVTFYFDLSGTGLVGMTDLHLYSWMPKEIEPWGSPSANTLLTKDPNNDALYSLTCIPTDLWGTTFDNFGLQIFGLIKTADGSKQTDDFSEANGNAFKLFDYTALSSSIAVVIPPDFIFDKPISIVVNLATAWSDGGSSQGQLIGEPVYIWLGMNSWSPGSQFNALGNPNARCDNVAHETNLAQYNFWPKDVFPTPATIKELDFLFNNGTWDKSARDVGGSDFKFKPLVTGAGTGAFTLFPKKATQLDIISIIYKPALDTLGSGLVQGVLTGSDRIFVHMEFETGSGVVIPVDISDVPKTAKLQMMTKPDGSYEFSFILNRLFTDTELPAGVEVKKIKFTFVNYDGFFSPFGEMPKNTMELSVSDN